MNRIHAFRYEDVDSVYWDSSNDVCISSRDKVYSWKPQNNKNRIFTVCPGINGMDVSPKYAAVACDDGKIYIWDILSGKIIFEKEIMDAPEDVAFTKDANQLWVISGYNCVKAIDLNSKSVKSIFVEDPQLGPPHPWTSYLYMTKDGEHCISLCYYADKYTLFDTKGNIIKTGVRYEDYIKENHNDILSEFVSPSESDNARKISSDGKTGMEIVGYSNGIIRLFSIQDRNIIKSLIMREDTLVKENR